MENSLTQSDADEVERLMLDHYSDIHAYVTRRFPKRLQPFFEADDVVHDVCVKAYRHLSTARPPNPRAWLLTIARNQMLDLMRQLRKLNHGVRDVVREDSLNQSDRDTVVLLQDLAVFRKTPSMSAIRRELLAALEKALGSISRRHQAVIQMRYLDGLSTAQAAGQLGLSEAAIAQLLKRALAAVRSELFFNLPSLSWTI